MQRSSGVADEVLGSDLDAGEPEDRHMIEVKKYANQPKHPEVSQCSSTGCA
jgi:hypothetical protein